MVNEQDMQAIQARGKLRSGKMRAFVRDISEAADALDLWVQLSESFAVKQKAHNETVAGFAERERQAQARAETAEAESVERVRAAEARTADAEMKAKDAEERLARVSEALGIEQEKLDEARQQRAALHAMTA